MSSNNIKKLITYIEDNANPQNNYTANYYVHDKVVVVGYEDYNYELRFSKYSSLLLKFNDDDTVTFVLTSGFDSVTGIAKPPYDIIKKIVKINFNEQEYFRYINFIYEDDKDHTEDDKLLKRSIERFYKCVPRHFEDSSCSIDINKFKYAGLYTDNIKHGCCYGVMFSCTASRQQLAYCEEQFQIHVVEKLKQCIKENNIKCTLKITEYFCK